MSEVLVTEVVQVQETVEVVVLDETTEYVEITERALQGVQGLSAYEVAVVNGFVGTEADWLASLQATGLQSIEEDTDPHLGGDLVMNNFQIKGQAESTDLVIDGGLI